MIRATLHDCVAEARASGTLRGLPDAHFIDGRFVAASSRRTRPTCDPATEAVFATVADGDADDVDRAVVSARRAFAVWRRVAPRERGRILARAAQRVRDHSGPLAVAETLDSGKKLSEALGDIGGVARTFEYYAGACDKLQGDTIPLDDDHFAYTTFEPAGVAAIIVPWNYPAATMARGVAPALAAGCTVVVKPAEQTPLTALMLAELLAESGLPPGVCNVVTGTGAGAGAPLAAHPRIDRLTFTGSVTTGIRVMQAAAANVTEVVLELGGKSPLVVLGDCDPASAAEQAFVALYENAGQICSAGSRLIVARALHDDVVERLARRLASLSIGHGLGDPGLGPVISAEQLARIDAHVRGARARGARVVTGGERRTDPATGRGWFYAPTVLDGLSPDDEAVQQEIFGPVLCVQPFDDLDEAIALANGTAYALVAGVLTNDFGLAHRLARELDAGQVYVNEYFAGGVEVPFGGNRRSGFGRERGLDAVRGYSRVKSVAARIGAATDAAKAV